MPIWKTMPSNFLRSKEFQSGVCSPAESTIFGENLISSPIEKWKTRLKSPFSMLY